MTPRSRVGRERLLPGGIALAFAFLVWRLALANDVVSMTRDLDLPDPID